MYQPRSAQATVAADLTTELERERIRGLARELDGIEIRDALIPSDSAAAFRLIRSLEARVERKHRSGVRSSLEFLYATLDDHVAAQV